MHSCAQKMAPEPSTASAWEGAIDANEAPVLHTERDVAWTTDGFANIKSIKVVTTSNVKLQLCPTSDPTVYILSRIECSPDEMNKGW